MKKQNIIRIVVGAALILLVPLIAMLFTDEVQWGVFDFVVIGTLLLGAGISFEFITTKVASKHRGAIAVVCIAAVLLIWAELAVGVFGSPFAGS